MKRFPGKLLLTGLALAAHPALAQTLPAAPATQRQVEFDVVTDVVFDSNIARSDRALAATRGLTLSDEILTPLGLIDLALPIGRSSLFLNGSAGYDFYVNNRVLNQARINVLGGAIGQVGPCRETLSGAYARSQTALSDLNTVAVANVEDHESIALGAVCGRALGLAPTIQVAESWEQNSAPARQLVDDRSFTATAGLAYRRPALGSLTLFGEFVDTTYPNELVVQGNALRTGGYQVYAAGVKFDRHLGARIQGEVSLSYSALSPAIAGSGSFEGATYSGNLTYRTSGRLSAQVQYARSVTPSNVVGANFSIDDTLSGELDYRLGPRLGLTLGASHMKHHYNTSASYQLTFPLSLRTRP